MSDTGQKILPNPGRVRVTTYKGSRKADTQKLVVQPNMEPDDEFNGLYYSTKNQGALLLAPPFNPATLQSLVTKNNILAQCIEAMEVNIDGTGYEIEATDPKASESDDAANKKKLTAFFKEPFPLWGFTEMRRKLRYDMESTGNGYLEVLRNAGRQIIFLRWADSKLMRLVRLDDPVEVEVELDRDGEKVKAKILTRERRYCQLLGTEQIFFKEFGSKRKLHRKTGKWESEGNPVPDDQQATEMLHFTVHKDARTPYGLPRWINQLPSVLGSRKAEEFNLDFFDSGAIPPAAIFLQGGQVTEQVGDQLRAYFGPKNKEPNRVAVVEVQSTSGTIDSAGHVQVKVERFGDNQKDAMFTNYDDKCEAHVRTAFRLPPLFVGKAQDYNFATAMVGYMVTEAQVFGPERTEFDEIVNRTIVKELGIEDYKFVSKPLTIQNIDAQLKALELAKDKSDGENFVEEVNSLTGLNLEYSKEVEQQALSAGKLGPDGKPIVDPIAVEQEKGKIQEKLKDKEHSHAKEMFQSTAEHQMTMAERQQAQAEEDKKKKLRAVKAESAEDIVTLVTVWSQAMGLERSAIPLSEEEKALVIGTVRKLDESKRAIFDNVLAVKSFANVSNDPTGLAEIASCCADHME